MCNRRSPFCLRVFGFYLQMASDFVENIHSLKWLLIVHFFLLVGSAAVNSPCIDELGHLPSGYVNSNGEFDAYCVNPPLARIIAAQPLVWFGPELTFYSPETLGRQRSEWQLAREFYSQLSLPQFLFFFCLGRLALIPMSLIGLSVVFHWGKELFGTYGGILSGCLWCFSPSMIAHGSLLTPDMTASVFGVLFWYMLWRSLRQGLSPRRALLLSIVLGLLVLSKFSWLIVFPLLVTAVVGYHVLADRIEFISLKLALMFILPLVMLNAFYGFDGSLNCLANYPFESNFFNWLKGLQPFNRVPLLLPYDVVRGLDLQKLDFEIGMPSYFCGNWRDHGWIQYYSVAILLKTPILTLFCICLSIFSCVRKTKIHLFQISKSEIVTLLCLVLPAAAFPGFVSLQTGFNHHHRYVLPVYPFMFVLGGGAVQICQRFQKTAVASQQLVLCMALALSLTLASIYPHCLSYFNYLAGGTKHGHWYLVNSNVDWGQDSLLLLLWFRENRDRNIQGVASVYPLNQLDLDAPGYPTEIKKGIYVFSKDKLHDSNDIANYFLNQEPIGRIGYSMNIYQVD